MNVKASKFQLKHVVNVPGFHRDDPGFHSESLGEVHDLPPVGEPVNVDCTVPMCGDRFTFAMRTPEQYRAERRRVRRKWLKALGISLAIMFVGLVLLNISSHPVALAAGLTLLIPSEVSAVVCAIGTIAYRTRPFSLIRLNDEAAPYNLSHTVKLSK